MNSPAEHRVQKLPDSALGEDTQSTTVSQAEVKGTDPRVKQNWVQGSAWKKPCHEPQDLGWSLVSLEGGRRDLAPLHIIHTHVIIIIIINMYTRFFFMLQDGFKIWSCQFLSILPCTPCYTFSFLVFTLETVHSTYLEPWAQGLPRAQWAPGDSDHHLITSAFQWPRFQFHR